VTGVTPPVDVAVHVTDVEVVLPTQAAVSGVAAKALVNESA
jgi:hypothetical protein